MRNKLKNILMISFLSVAGIFGVSSAIINNQTNEIPTVEKAEATTSSHKYTALQAVDEVGLSWDGGANIKVHLYYIHIDPDCVFKTTNAVNATKAELDAANSGASLGWDVNNDASVDLSGDFNWYYDGHNKRSYRFNLPWFITGFTYKYYNTDGVWTKTEMSIYDKQEYRPDFIYNSYNDAQVSTRTWAAYDVYTDVPLYTLDFDTKGGTEIDSQEVMQYQKCEEPSDPTKSGYTFWKWTATDSLDASEYTFNTSTLTDDTTIFAQFTPTNPTVYFVNGFSSGTPTIHYWGGVGTGTTWPGNPMQATSAKIYCSKSGSWSLMTIYKYTISGSPAYLQINRGNDGEKTGDLTITNGGIYWFGPDAGTFTNVASYLIDFEGSMGSYTYDGKSYSNSICNLGGSASTLVSRYNTLANSGGDVATSITNSTINTYSTPVTSPSSKSDIAMPTLIAQINKNTTNHIQQMFSPLNLFGAEEDMSTIIVIVASSIALLSITALSILVIKKRKNKEE